MDRELRGVLEKYQRDPQANLPNLLRIVRRTIKGLSFLESPNAGDPPHKVEIIAPVLRRKSGPGRGFTFYLDTPPLVTQFHSRRQHDFFGVDMWRKSCIFHEPGELLAVTSQSGWPKVSGNTLQIPRVGLDAMEMPHRGLQMVGCQRIDCTQEIVRRQRIRLCQECLREIMGGTGVPNRLLTRDDFERVLSILSPCWEFWPQPRHSIILIRCNPEIEETLRGLAHHMMPITMGLRIDTRLE